MTENNGSGATTAPEVTGVPAPLDEASRSSEGSPSPMDDDSA